MQNQLIVEILEYMRQQGGSRSSWYVGIANDPQSCLFERHGVDQVGGIWIHGDAGTDVLARTIEKYFLDQGFVGGGGGGDRTTRFVYAYQIAPNTRE